MIPFIIVGFQLNAQKADLAKSDAIMAEGSGNYNEAAELYKKAIDLYSSREKTDTFCIFKAGQNYIRIKNYDEGVKYLETALGLNYKDKNLYLYLADGYNGQKKNDKAVEYYEKGIVQYPEEKAAYLKKLSYHYYNNKKYSEAIKTIDDALVLMPDNSKLLYLKGNSLSKLNNYDDAISVFEGILSNEPENKKVISKLGVAIFKQTEGLYKNRVKQYEKIKNPDRIDYHNYRKNIEQISKGYKKALPYLEKATVNNPNDKLALNCLMVSYSRLNMKDKANEIKTILNK